MSFSTPGKYSPEWPALFFSITYVLSFSSTRVVADCTITQDPVCYQDCQGQNPCQRCFPNQATGVDASTLSWESCAQGCHDMSYSWAAVENGNECYCSNSPIDSGSCPESDGMCDDNVCPGDPNGVESCGSDGYMMVYQFDCGSGPSPFPPPFPPPTPPSPPPTPGPSPPGPSPPPGPHPGPSPPAPPSKKKKDKWSPGDILVFTTLLSFTLIMIGGAFYKYKFQEARSPGEMIIMKEGFMSLPGLVKDGWLYLRGKCGGGSEYDSI